MKRIDAFVPCKNIIILVNSSRRMNFQSIVMYYAGEEEEKKIVRLKQIEQVKNSTLIFGDNNQIIN